MSYVLSQHCIPFHYSTQPLIPINFFFLTHSTFPIFLYFYYHSQIFSEVCSNLVILWLLSPRGLLASMLQYSFHLFSFPWTKSRIGPGPVDCFTSYVREHFCNALRDKHPSDSIPVIYQSLSGDWNYITLTTFISLKPPHFFFCSFPSFLYRKTYLLTLITVFMNSTLF